MKRLIPAAALAALLLAVLPATPSVASGFPSAPTGIKIVGTTHSSFTVGYNRSTNATGYRLYVSRISSDVYVANIKSGSTTAGLHVYSSSTLRITASGLSYTTAPYYYRLVAVNGSNRAFSSSFYSVGLKPSTPTSLQVARRHLLWSSGPATGFTVQWSLQPDMTSPVTKSVLGEAHQYTPYGLRSGSTYYFRVRAVNQATVSSWTSPAVPMSVTTHEQTARVMTYNILKNTSDGQPEFPGSPNIVASWVPGRRDAAAALIESVDPDIVAVQEGNNWVGDPSNRVRQVDSLDAALRRDGADYTVANTESCCVTGVGRTGDYVLYKPAVYNAYKPGGHWNLDAGTSFTNYRWAAYQPLQNRTSGAKVLFVSTHPIVGAGTTFDQRRQTETKNLLADAAAEAASLGGVPVVYAGDFNSNPKQHALDGPGVEMRRAHVVDARDAAPTHTNEKYDSVNEYMRTPPAFSIFIDYVWAGPDISVTSWGQALNLSGGKFVGTIPSDHNPIYATVRFPY